MDVRNNRLSKACKHLIYHCGGLKPYESVLVLHDEGAYDFAALIAGHIETSNNKVNFKAVRQSNIHGEQVSDEVECAMVAADLIICHTKFSLAHTDARLNASINGARFLSLPDYSVELLLHEAMGVDFYRIGKKTKILTKLFDTAKVIEVSTENGTRLVSCIEDRHGNNCPGYVDEPGSLGSPPDAEVNIAPLEGTSNGVIVVDGSIAHPLIGLLDEKVQLEIKNGLIVDIQGERKTIGVLESIFKSVDSNKTKVLAEIGFGFNPMAQLSGVMLLDEGTSKTVHFGFGSNVTIGGLNKVPFHLDFVCREPNITLDGKSVMQKGELNGI